MSLSHRLAKECYRLRRYGFARYLANRLRIAGRCIFDASWGLVFKLLFVTTRFKIIWKFYPHEISKLKTNYLALSFSKKDRLRIFLNHYYFLKKHFQPSFVSRVIKNEVVLWEQTREQSRYRISMMLDAVIFEGELSLNLTENDTTFYALAFAFVPAKVVALPGAQTLFISRLQGARNSLEEIRKATKAFNGMRPQEVLVASARGVAQALSLSGLAGVRTNDQVAYCRQKMCNDCTFFNYDQFWEDVGGIAATTSVFSLPLAPQHPLEAVSRKHRTRKKLKYELETQMIQQVRQVFTKECLLSNETMRQ